MGLNTAGSVHITPLKKNKPGLSDRLPGNGEQAWLLHVG